MVASVGVSVALGSPCTPFHVAVVTGVVKSDGSITIVRRMKNHGPRTHSVGATCHPHPTPHAGLFLVGVHSVPLIHTFLGESPMLIISRHISWARPQQPSSGNRKGMQGGGTVRGAQLVALIALNTCWAWASEMHPNHHQGQNGHHQMLRSTSRIHRNGQGSRGGSSGSGMGKTGP